MQPGPLCPRALEPHLVLDLDRAGHAPETHQSSQHAMAEHIMQTSSQFKLLECNEPSASWNYALSKRVLLVRPDQSRFGVKAGPRVELWAFPV